MQRQGKGLEYGRMALFTGSSFFIYKQNIQTYFSVSFLWIYLFPKMISS